MQKCEIICEACFQRTAVAPTPGGKKDQAKKDARLAAWNMSATKTGQGSWSKKRVRESSFFAGNQIVKA